jgi:hypothetical protein
MVHRRKTLDSMIGQNEVKIGEHYFLDGKKSISSCLVVKFLHHTSSITLTNTHKHFTYSYRKLDLNIVLNYSLQNSIHKSYHHLSCWDRSNHHRNKHKSLEYNFLDNKYFLMDRVLQGKSINTNITRCFAGVF